MALKLTASEAADKWSRRTAAATQDVAKGVDRVTTAPGQAAAAAQDVMIANLMAALNSGLWKKRVGAVSLEDWKKYMKEKGVPRIQAGVTAATASQTDMYSKLFPAIEATLQEVNQTKRGDIEANITRATTFMRGMNKRAIRQLG